MLMCLSSLGAMLAEALQCTYTRLCCGRRRLLIRQNEHANSKDHNNKTHIQTNGRGISSNKRYRYSYHDYPINDGNGNDDDDIDYYNDNEMEALNVIGNADEGNNENGNGNENADRFQSKQFTMDLQGFREGLVSC